MSLQPVVKRLADYQPPAYTITQVELFFELDPQKTQVRARSHFKRMGETTEVLLDGQMLSLQSLTIDDQPWQQYELVEAGLRLWDLPDNFILELVTTTAPEANLALEGLYLSDGAYCTQCEAEGFRKITYYLDRPDVMAVFTTHIIANTKQYPHLLSNGNLVNSSLLADGRTQVTWHDPFPKPCYLFALVAGNFDVLEGSYTTSSGREVLLQFYVDRGRAAHATFAMEALKRSMQFDEAVYGREYDLDRFMVVAVDFFNMGAMENKGLNIFNSKFVLADAANATDVDYFNIESIIAHEYFHNWTGNRITCRDWFQLSLKEGLTVFRDQQFSAAMGSATLCRIDAIKTIRSTQFAEDAGPMAHPIRPAQVVEMNNFYTVTVYDKGAEVIRMQHTLLGDEGFRRGMDLYFERHDGQAVTCDDFVQAMEDANQRDLGQFRRWYSQAGTPTLTAKLVKNASTWQLQLAQSTPETADGSAKHPFHIPVRYELISPSQGLLNQGLLELVDEQASYELSVMADDQLLVLLCDFSAPVKLKFEQSLEELLTVAKYSRDGVSRWDAMQSIWLSLIQQRIELQINGQESTQQHVLLPTALLEMCQTWLQQPEADQALIAELLTLPSFDSVIADYQPVDVSAVCSAIESIELQLAESLREAFLQCYQAIPQPSYQYNQHQVALRTLKSCCLRYLARAENYQGMVREHYDAADNMTNRLVALTTACQLNLPERVELCQAFEQSYAADPLLFDKLSIAIASRNDNAVLADLDAQTRHASFSWTNPNRVRAIYLAFANFNPRQFHAPSGDGYRLLADIVCRVDGQNPQLSARLITPLLGWRHFSEPNASLMQQQLTRIAAMNSISPDLYEKVSRSL